MTRFVLGGTTVQFNADPVRPGGETPQLQQQTGRDGGGELYVYTKGSSRRHRHRLAFANISAAVQQVLLSFLRVDAVGVKNKFTWIDQAEVSRSVRFERPNLQLTQVGPDHYAGEIILLEEI